MGNGMFTYSDNQTPMFIHLEIPNGPDVWVRIARNDITTATISFHRHHLHTVKIPIPAGIVLWNTTDEMAVPAIMGRVFVVAWIASYEFRHDGLGFMSLNSQRQHKFLRMGDGLMKIIAESEDVDNSSDDEEDDDVVAQDSPR